MLEILDDTLQEMMDAATAKVAVYFGQHDHEMCRKLYQRSEPPRMLEIFDETPHEIMDAATAKVAVYFAQHSYENCWCYVVVSSATCTEIDSVTTEM